MAHGITIRSGETEFHQAQPVIIRRRDSKADRKLGLLLALSVALIAMVVGLAQWQGSPSVAPDDVASVLFQNG